MLILVETPGGYGLFKVKNSKLLKLNSEELAKHLESPSAIVENVDLQAFSKFKETSVALSEANALIESKMGKGLKKFLKKNIVKAGLIDKLAVNDKALVIDIKNKLGLDVVYSSNTNELIRGIREQIHELVSGLTENDAKIMALSLSHSLSRFKLKFSPDKIDTMIIQAIGLLDDLDRELNNFAMRLKEWYGWHFPELSKIVTDNLIYAQIVKKIGFRSNAQSSDLSDTPEEISAEIKQAAEISMGTEITDEDLSNILELADRVEELYKYRSSLSDYLKFRMNALAPNLTHMVGELVGARLISHCGSLINLAKYPSSTVQILGAEKALFRALKTKSQTPKYGLIYHATLVGQTAPKLKGKISRVLAAKLSLCIRVDALTDENQPTVALSSRKYVEKKLEEMTDSSVTKLSKTALAKPPLPRFEPKRMGPKAKGNQYNVSTDSIINSQINNSSSHLTKRTFENTGENQEGLQISKKKKKKVNNLAQ